MFKTTGGTGTFKLGDIKPNNMTWSDDFIQFLDPTTSRIDNDKVYTYWSEQDSDPIGWYLWSDGVTYCNDVEFPFGTAFIATFSTPENNPSLTFSGEVQTGDVTIITEDEDGNAVPYMFIGNPYPVDITLENVVPTGMTWSDDFIQFLDPSNSRVDNDRVYTYWSETDSDPIGWYLWSDGTTFCNEAPFAAGEGFICTFGGKVTLTIKTPIKQ